MNDYFEDWPEIPEVEDPTQNVEEAQADRRAEKEASLQSVLLDHPPVAREKILTIARKFHISDTDPIWPIVLAIREGDEKYTEAVRLIQDACLNAPDKIRAAVEGISVANQENAQVAYETKTMIVRMEGLISDLEDEVLKTNKNQIWQHRWMVGFAAACLLSAAWSTIECRISERVATGIQTDRFALLANAQLLLDAQKIILERGRLNSELQQFQTKWKSLQDAWKVQATPELIRTRERLEAEYAVLKQKAQDLITKEARAYEK